MPDTNKEYNVSDVISTATVVSDTRLTLTGVSRKFLQKLCLDDAQINERRYDYQSIEFADQDSYARFDARMFPSNKAYKNAIITLRNSFDKVTTDINNYQVNDVVPASADILLNLREPIPGRNIVINYSISSSRIEDRIGWTMFRLRVTDYVSVKNNNDFVVIENTPEHWNTFATRVCSHLDEYIKFLETCDIDPE